MEEHGKDDCREKASKKLIAGTGGTLGVISLLGACGGACTAAALPLGGILSAIGLSGLVVFLPYLRLPLMAIALVLSFLILRSVAKRGKPVAIAGVALLLGGALSFAGFQAFRASPCEAMASQQQAGIRPSEGDLALFFDPEMGGCEKACGFHGKVDEKRIIKQPGAKAGDLVRCPVSGVVFEVKPESSQVTLNGKRYYTCCPSCAADFEQKKKVLGKT
jgi:hypothetical protein